MAVCGEGFITLSLVWVWNSVVVTNYLVCLDSPGLWEKGVCSLRLWLRFNGNNVVWYYHGSPYLYTCILKWMLLVIIFDMYNLQNSLCTKTCFLHVTGKWCFSSALTLFSMSGLIWGLTPPVQDAKCFCIRDRNHQGPRDTMQYQSIQYWYVLRFCKYRGLIFQFLL